MSDLYVSPITKDIEVSGAGVIRLTKTIEEDAAQRLRCKLRWFLSEWFLNTLEGIPYFEQILIKNPDLSLVRSTLTKVITGDRAVDHVDSLDVEYDESARTLALSFTAILVSGDLLTVELGLNVLSLGNPVNLPDGSLLSV